MKLNQKIIFTYFIIILFIFTFKIPIISNLDTSVVSGDNFFN